MLEISTSTSTFPENSEPATGNRGNEGTGGGGNRSVPGEFGEEEKLKLEEGDWISGGNRWPRQETLALLKIRSEMDVAFRESSVKAPLWEEVSRKLAERGFNRSAKKCKEKFENIYKYHKRTKEGRSGRPNGKNYRFFEQLEALESQAMAATPMTCPTNVPQSSIPCSTENVFDSFMDNSTPTTCGSSEESEGTRKKKRKLTEFFERLMKQVVEKQENFQRKFIEALEKCEQDRIAREDAWKMQELSRIKRERELLVQERSIAAAKDAAVLAFLKKFSDQPSSLQSPLNPNFLEKAIVPVEKEIDKQENGNEENFFHPSSSRWPKEEVDALIRIKTNLEYQYQENGPKGPLWEEISMAMKNLGYDRSSKRCKEKWENINKYFKKVKESNRKRRPGDSKTCPYFNQLDVLYKLKTKEVDSSVSSGYELKPEELLMHIMNGQEDRQRLESETEKGGRQNVDQNPGEGDSEDENEGDGYQIVANSSSSMAIMG